MTVLALIGAKALYLLFAWLLSAAAAAWLTNRQGWGEKVGLAAGLLLSVIGLALVLVVMLVIRVLGGSRPSNPET